MDMSEPGGSATPDKNDKSAAAGDASASKVDEEMKDEEKKDGEEEKKEGDEEKKDPEATEGIVKNPSRVLKAQEQHLKYLNDDNQRYYPVLDTRFSGFLILKDLPREGKDGDEPE